jgi:hypothetical protein
MPFTYKNKQDFTELDVGKKCYYLARLYIAKDGKKSSVKYKARLFACINYLKKQPEPILSVLYNYLTDNRHDGLMIWEVVPKAILYDQERRRKPIKKVDEYKQFDESMLKDILSE